MNDQDFRRGLERVLLRLGFERHGKAVRRHTPGVWTLLESAPGFGRQRHINVGFWLEALGIDCPAQVERTHLYFRLERLFADHHETIVVAGALDDPRQPEAFQFLTTLLQGHIDRELRGLGTEEGLRRALETGRLAQGLITKGARDHLRGHAVARPGGANVTLPNERVAPDGPSSVGSDEPSSSGRG